MTRTNYILNQNQKWSGSLKEDKAPDGRINLVQSSNLQKLYIFFKLIFEMGFELVFRPITKNSISINEKR